MLIKLSTWPCLEIRIQDEDNMKTDNNSFERAEEFKYLGTTLTHQNSIQGEIKSRLKSENACYHSVQNLWFSSLLSRNAKIKIYRIRIFPVVGHGCETLSLTLREERRLRMFENRVLGEYLGQKGLGNWGRGWKDYIGRSLMICFTQQILFG
jgi:hypothetical protein